jgi:hypothetical protein
MSTAIAAARAKTKGKVFLKDVLNAYGVETPEEAAIAIAEWNRRKKEALENGTWVWHDGQMPYQKTTKNKEVSSFTNRAIEDEMRNSMMRIKHRDTNDAQEMVDSRRPQSQITHHKGEDNPSLAKTCNWSLLVDGKKLYLCGNVLQSDLEKSSRRCNWHAIECRHPSHDDHSKANSSMDPLLSKRITIANDEAACSSCYAAARTSLPRFQQQPPMLEPLRLPGVHLAQAQKVAKQARMKDTPAIKVMATRVFTKTSQCTWQGHRPGQKSSQVTGQPGHDDRNHKQSQTKGTHGIIV